MTNTFGQISYEARQAYYRRARFDNWAATEWKFLGKHMVRAEEEGAEAVRTATLTDCARLIEVMASTARSCGNATLARHYESTARFVRELIKVPDEVEEIAS